MSDQKKPEAISMEEKIATAVAKAIADQLPLIAGVMAKTSVDAQVSAKNSEAQAIAAARPSGLRCQGCLQLLPAGMTSETHPHRKMVVFPKGKRFAQWFQGVRINGVLYLSNHAGHHITVPEDANIDYLLQQWEENEDQTQMGRVAEHNSGSVHSPQTAQTGWR